MAWPYDAVLRTNAPGEPVRSTDTNDWQARIVDLHRVRTAPILDAMPEFIAAAATWEQQAGSPAWDCQNTTGKLLIDISKVLNSTSPNGSILEEVRIKVSENAAFALSAALFVQDVKFFAATTAPAARVSKATDSSPATGVYDTLVLTPATPITLTLEETCYVEVTAGAIGDLVIAARAEYYPITMTP